MKNKNQLKTAENLADLLDTKFEVLGVKFGIDPILGLIPGGGDTVSLFLSLYILWVGVDLGLPSKKIRKMVMNIGMDYCVGLIPFLGDILDFSFKANTTKIGIIKKHLEEDAIEGEVVD